MADLGTHWQRIWRAHSPQELSWYQPGPTRSATLIAAVAPPPGSSVIDVGGGASTLVDQLLDAGYRDLTVLDIAEAALTTTRDRLGARADAVTFVASDVRVFTPTRTFDLWHDRAVFHFLTETDDRIAYLERLTTATSPGSHVVVATFADDGPPTCSGLPVVRYSPPALERALGSAFTAIEFQTEHHHTPGGAEQPFVYGVFRRR